MSLLEKTYRKSFVLPCLPPRWNRVYALKMSRGAFFVCGRAKKTGSCL